MLCRRQGRGDEKERHGTNARNNHGFDTDSALDQVKKDRSSSVVVGLCLAHPAGGFAVNEIGSCVFGVGGHFRSARCPLF